jgi:predicted enzyme related to lactoylglutathione lyase
MAKVLGIGGVFFKANDSTALFDWYKSHLGMNCDAGTMHHFQWRHTDDIAKKGMTVWALFPRETKYFGPGGQTFMVNYIVDDLDGMLETLRAAGATVDEHRGDYDYGRFGWATDAEGNRFELWQPLPV